MNNNFGDQNDNINFNGLFSFLNETIQNKPKVDLKFISKDFASYLNLNENMFNPKHSIGYNR